MKVRDVMSAHPVVATAGDADAARIRQLMEDADVHHMPVVDGDDVVAVWARSEDGAMSRLGRDRVIELVADDDAEAAMVALLRDAEVVLVRDDGLATGILTRSDALAILRGALGRGVGRRYPRPAVVRVAGARGSGASALIARTIGRLAPIDAVVLRADGPASRRHALERLPDARLVVLEDRGGEPDLAHGVGEDVQVAVLPVGGAADVAAATLRDAQAIVLLHDDGAPAGVVRAAAEACAGRFPGRRVFAIGPADDDPGMEAWVRWVRRQALRRRG